MLTRHIFVCLRTILPKMKVVAIVYLFAKLASLCLPSVSPLSPLLAWTSLVWTSFAPRSDLVKIAASQSPARRGFGKALQWSAAWSAAAAAAVVVACAAASGQGAVFGQRNKRFVKGLESFPCLRISPL